MKEVILYTDGACEPNPGPGGYGIVLIYPKLGRRIELSGGFRLTTNNRMEIYAVIKGLELLKGRCKVTVYTDSRYLVDAMTKGWVAKWKEKNWWRTNRERALNIDLWEKMLELTERHQVEFVWVKGHAGNPENELCDRLSYAALRQKDLPVDEGYENKPAEPERIKVSREGQPCPKCSTPLVKLLSRKSNYYLHCPNCKANYQIENKKGKLEEMPSLF